MSQACARVRAPCFWLDECLKLASDGHRAATAPLAPARARRMLSALSLDIHWRVENGNNFSSRSRASAMSLHEGCTESRVSPFDLFLENCQNLGRIAACHPGICADEPL